MKGFVKGIRPLNNSAGEHQRAAFRMKAGEETDLFGFDLRSLRSAALFERFKVLISGMIVLFSVFGLSKNTPIFVLLSPHRFPFIKAELLSLSLCYIQKQKKYIYF